MINRWLAVAGVSGFLAVAAGAFGAHSLKNVLSVPDLETYRTAALYHLVHAVAIGLVAVARPATAFRVAGWSFLIGTVVFSGSLYALALTGEKRLGMITPLGGVAFLTGWAALVWAAVYVEPRNSASNR